MHIKFGWETYISINVKAKIECDNLCWHLIGTKKPSSSPWASTTSILHSKESSQRQWRSWATNTKGSINKDKGTQTQVYGNRGKIFYSILTLKVYPPLMLHNGSIYIPKMGNRGFNQSVSMHMEGKWSSFSLLDE